MRGQAVCIRCLEARETEDIPLVTRTPMVLEMGHYDLTNRVCRDEGCKGGRVIGTFGDEDAGHGIMSDDDS